MDLKKTSDQNEGPEGPLPRLLDLVLLAVGFYSYL